MADDIQKLAAPGMARCPGPSTKDIIRGDGDNAPSVLTEESYEFLGDADIPYSRYTCADFQQKEFDKLWPNVWQFACRQEHIAKPGECYVYDIGPYSTLLVRQTDGRIKGFINSCKHRGMQLRPCGSRGALKQIRCPFHGFTWNVDGKFKEAPCQWDFPHLNEDSVALDEVHVDVWEGFVFVHFGADPPPLLEHLEVLPRHFQHWPMSKRHIAVHIEKTLPANWKLAQEAFLEAFHVLATHAQAIPRVGDANAQYDVFGEHISRFVHTVGFPSPHFKKEMTEQMLLDSLGDGDLGTLKDGETARSVYAEHLRKVLGDMMQADLSHVSISEMIDSIEYFCFPNLFIFPGIGFPMVYRFRPNGSDIDTSIFDLFIMTLTPEGEDAPSAPDPIKAGLETRFSDIPQLDNALALIYDQDVDNLDMHTKGIKASRKSGQMLGNYQEVRIRHFHKTLDDYLAR